MSRPNRFRHLLVLWTLFFAFTAFAQSTRSLEKKLPPTYRHWLLEEVPYIIESQERHEFLALGSDAERDNFIHQFWEARNPTPGSPSNAYKDEHYRRLAYANDHFGNTEAKDGWATDRGMTYITLGAPASLVTYPNSRNVRPMIIWFFQSQTPALPIHFYVLFYKRSQGEDYTIYSPYQDGPNRLITGLESLNDQSRSLKQIRDSLGDEVARTTLCLIPTEPVNLNSYEPSLTSDALLANIRGLADNPVEVDRIARNRRRERVTASIVNPSGTPDAEYTVSRDAENNPTVQYLIRFDQPEPLLVGTTKAGTTGFDLTLRNHITTSEGKPVFDTVTVYTGRLQPSQIEAARQKAFAAEDRFPLAPGSYVIQSTLTNSLNLDAHRLTKQVVVPERHTSDLAISTPVVYASKPARTDLNLPFVYAGMRFPPQAIGTAPLHAGQPLTCMFQLWLPRNSDQSIDKDPVQLHYLYGSVASGSKALAEADEDVDPSNADAAGNLVTGHSFPTTDLAPGNYRVIIRATQGKHRPAYATMTLKIVPKEVPVGTWTAYGPPEPQDDAVKRSLSAQASKPSPLSSQKR